MYKFLHYFTKINTFVLFVCLGYFMAKYTVGLIIYFLFGKHLLFELIYIIVSISFCLKCVKISSPYAKYIKL